MSNVEKQLDRIEHLLTQLIGTVANIQTELIEFKQEMRVKQETYQKFEQAHFERNALAGQVALLHQRLEGTTIIAADNPLGNTSYSLESSSTFSYPPAHFIPLEGASTYD